MQTDLFLIQVQPFEQRFTQSQAGGGGGGGGGGGEEDGNISRRQREVLLATWNLQRNAEGAGDRDAERNADNARMLAEVQTTLKQQTATLVDRARARALTGQDQSVAQFVKNMEEAAKAMDPAAKNLGNMKLADAVKYEQQALQLLLRAESVFRDIQVAMRQQGGGGGGGGGSQASRDVSEMTELEMDLAKNQYETEQSPGEQGGGAASEAEDELMRRLRELARRQEQMAREAQRQNQQQTEAQKWQQEQLRRELGADAAAAAAARAAAVTAVRLPVAAGTTGASSRSSRASKASSLARSHSNPVRNPPRNRRAAGCAGVATDAAGRRAEPAARQRTAEPCHRAAGARPRAGRQPAHRKAGG